MTCRVTLVSVLLVVCTGSLAAAQTPPPAAPSHEDDADRDVNLAQPDFTLAALPTTLRLPRYRSAFRITHRFARPLNQGDVGDLLGDLFGLDQGALIGLEYRFGVMRGLQAVFHRSSDKTIQLLGQYSLLQQRDVRPLGLDLLVAVEGADNLSERFAPTVGAVVSRELGDRGAVYLEGLFVGNSNASRDRLGENGTFLLGVAGRVRVRPSLYLLFEATPRLAGYSPGVHPVSVGVEKRSGGHTFQLNVSNGFATTFGQLARGGLKADNADDWHLGFSISRKFF